jgi:hypothetical protein
MKKIYSFLSQRALPAFSIVCMFSQNIRTVILGFIFFILSYILFLEEN